MAMDEFDKPTARGRYSALKVQYSVDNIVSLILSRIP